MKVLHVLNKLCYSGAEIMYVDAAEELQRLGCELYVVNTAAELGEYASAFEKAGYKVLHRPYPKNALAKIAYYREMVDFVKKEKIDVIHTHSSAMKWGMALVARIAGIKSIYTFHNCFRSRKLTWPYQTWLRWSAKNLLGCRFQTISDSVYNNELNYYHNPTTKVYNWFGNKRFYPASESEKEEIRKSLSIPAEALVIISVGGCSPIKRHDEIIRILPELIAEYPDLIYIHLGKGISTDDEKALAKQLNVDSHIRFLGNQRDVRKYLIASDIYIMPSRFEGIPITTIEAMACKIPAILYDVPGLHDFNSDAKCSLLIPENNQEIISAIRMLLSNRDLKKEIVENAYRLVTTKYFLPKNIKEIYSLYCDRK